MYTIYLKYIYIYIINHTSYPNHTIKVGTSQTTKRTPKGLPHLDVATTSPINIEKLTMGLIGKTNVGKSMNIEYIYILYIYLYHVYIYIYIHAYRKNNNVYDCIYI